jgi:ketosteroid isomerase-like protein
MDGLAALCTEDVVNVPFEDWPEDPVYRGREGMKKLASEWWELFDGTQMKIERLLDEGDRLVVLILHTGMTGGMTVEQHLGGITRFRDGLMCEARWFLGFERTLAEAGLSA